MAGRGIGYNELSESLKNMIQAGTSGYSGIIDLTPELSYNVVFNEQDVITNIVFVDGEVITTFNPETDILVVYKDGLRLTEGVDYSINPNNISIDSLKGGWIITDEIDTIFSFIVKMNCNCDINIGVADDEDIYAMFNGARPGDDYNYLMAKSYTPGTSDIVIPAKTYLEGPQTIVGDVNLVPMNIRGGSTIFGTPGIFSNDATATAAQILSGYTAALHGEMVAGTMPNNIAVAEKIKAGQTYNIKEGYHDGRGTVLAESLAPQTSATATAADILNGKTAWMNGVQYVGEMTDNGAVTSVLPAGEKYDIEKGYHNGEGYVIAAPLASQTSATATALDILAGKTSWVNGEMISGSIPSVEGGEYIPGTTDIIIKGGQYLVNDIIIKGSELLVPENIKDGVTIFGVTGTDKGSDASPETETDLVNEVILQEDIESPYQRDESVSYTINLPEVDYTNIRTTIIEWEYIMLNDYEDAPSGTLFKGHREAYIDFDPSVTTSQTIATINIARFTNLIVDLTVDGKTAFYTVTFKTGYKNNNVDRVVIESGSKAIIHYEYSYT